MGYARDFIGAIESVLAGVAERGVRVIANAGGVNPPACAAAVRAGRREARRVGQGAHRRRHRRRPAAAHRRADRRRGTRSPTWTPASRSRPCAIACSRPTRTSARCRSSRRWRAARTSSSRAARPTRRSRWRRCATSSAGRADDWDRLAAGIIAGHIIECGAQCSGGNCLYDWQNIPDLANVGYPIVEGAPTGRSSITKHPNTGGRISVPSVTEQLVYEMGDPHSYITPDVVADFTSIRLEPMGENRVRVFGIKGRPRDRQAQGVDRVSRRLQGRRHARVRLAGRAREGAARRPRAARAARPPRASSSIRSSRSSSARRRRTAVSPATRTIRRRSSSASACVAEDKAAVERFTREIVPLVLNGPPSVTGFAGGRPKVEEIVAYWPALIDKQRRADESRGALVKVRLLDIAHARSGDKGDTANVGVIALQPRVVPILERVPHSRARRASISPAHHRRRRALRASQSERAELPAARRARRRRNAVAQDGRTGQGVFDRSASPRSRRARRRSARRRANGQLAGADARVTALFVQCRSHPHHDTKRAVGENPCCSSLIGISRVEDRSHAQHGELGAQRKRVIELRREAPAHRAVTDGGHGDLCGGVGNALLMPELDNKPAVAEQDFLNVRASAVEKCLARWHRVPARALAAR